MQKVLTTEQMREVDRLTTEKYGIPPIILMENAAHAVARVITEKLGGSVKGRSVLVLCGKGNNGGDGAALARILSTFGADVVICLLGRLGETKGDAKENFEIVRRLADSNVDPVRRVGEIIFSECSTSDEWTVFLDEYFHYLEPEIIVDAMLGTGLSKPLSGMYEEAASWVRAFNVEGVEQDTMVFSIDVPSGLDADGSFWIGQSVRAHSTISFTSPKQANVIPPVCDWSGELHLANIGSPMELIDAQPSQLYLAEQADTSEWLKKTAFSGDSYKNKRGHALLIAGSENYSGAAVMSGNAAIRSGAGLTTLCVPDSVKVEIASRSLPEVIVKAVRENEAGELSNKAFSELKETINAADAIAVGCGLSATDPGVEKLVREIVENRKTPVIIDAGALWFYSPFAEDVSSPNVSKGSADNNSTEQNPLILTPHEGEFMRLLGTKEKNAITDRVAAVRDFATTHKVILVLKGERVLIGEPSGKVVVNPTGNSGLGKAGNGDTLTGILAGFVAQAVQMKINIFETVVAAVYVAGMAGDVAEKKYGKRVMTASDVRECMVDVFAHFEAE